MLASDYGARQSGGLAKERGRSADRYIGSPFFASAYARARSHSPRNFRCVALRDVFPKCCVLCVSCAAALATVNPESIMNPRKRNKSNIQIVP